MKFSYINFNVYFIHNFHVYTNSYNIFRNVLLLNKVKNNLYLIVFLINYSIFIFQDILIM